MLEIRKSAVDFDEQEMRQLEGIILDSDTVGALTFLKKSVYRKIEGSQHGKLKCHLDGTVDPSARFKQNQWIVEQSIANQAINILRRSKLEGDETHVRQQSNNYYAA